MFDDLLNVPYKPHGRSAREGFDCYGLILECCRRAGTPLHDIYYEKNSVPCNELESYIQNGLNVRRIPAAKPHCIVQIEINGKLHTGFMIDRTTVMHTTIKGVHTTAIAIYPAAAFYEVTND